MADAKAELIKRKIGFKDSDSLDDLISLLIKEDNKPTDWGQIYSRVLYHTGMVYEEISRRTIPQINAILDGAEENISIKMGMPSMMGSSPPPPSGLSDKAPSLDQFASFANAFGGI